MDFTHFRLLAVFVTVVETGSFAAAARHLNGSRSQISEQVSKLEDVLGVRLLQRSTRHLKLTSEGTDVYDKARQLPTLLSDVESTVNSSEPRGRVAVTMNHDVAHKIILPLLGDFQQQYPLIILDLVLDDEKQDLIAQQLDLGIRIGLPNDNSLVGRIMHEESLSIFASRAFITKNGVPKTIKDIEKCRWILLTQLSNDNVFRVRNKGKTIELHPANYYRCNSPFMMQNMIVSGLGIGPLAPSMIKEELENKQLVPIMPSIKSEPLVFSLVYPSRRQVPQRTRVLIDFLLKNARFRSKR